MAMPILTAAGQGACGGQFVATVGRELPSSITASKSLDDARAVTSEARALRMTSFLARVYAFKFFDSFILIFPLYTVMFVDAGMKPVEIGVCLTAWSVTSFVL